MIKINLQNIANGDIVIRGDKTTLATMETASALKGSMHHLIVGLVVTTKEKALLYGNAFSDSSSAAKCRAPIMLLP